ncbi:MAG: hypothetical protein K8H88_18925, partial [Sandaracinaceae bacterium]|nr:hypothetical protein [Sandaracinaceae bacterium]
MSSPLDRSSADIGVVYFDGGTAHRSTTFALVEAINRAAGRARAEPVDALELFAQDPGFSRIVGTGVRFFNSLLRSERVFALEFWLKVGRFAHDSQSSPRALERMSRFFEPRPYRVLVSTIPLYNETLYRALRLVRPSAIGVTAVVDFDEPIARYWFSPRAGAQHYLCYNDVQLEQARERDPSAKAHRIRGPIVHPDFGAPLDGAARARELAALGLPSDRPVGLLSFGGQGSSRLRELGTLLDEVGRDFSAIYVCGRDRRSQDVLRGLRARHPKAVLGFSTEMPRLLRLADFFIGKPGPLSIAEAIASGTPPILFR